MVAFSYVVITCFFYIFFFVFPYSSTSYDRCSHDAVYVSFSCILIKRPKMIMIKIDA
jgi:hypothetical protein